MDDSPLNDIPAELRNRIYELALVNSDSTDIDLVPEQRQLLTVRSGGNEISKLPALTATCKQVRKEALPILLGQNNFNIVAHIGLDYHASHACVCLKLRGWLSGLGQDVRLLRDITVDMGPLDDGIVDCPVVYDFLEAYKGIKSAVQYFALQPKFVLQAERYTFNDGLDTKYDKAVSFRLEIVGISAEAARSSLHKEMKEVYGPTDEDDETHDLERRIEDLVAVFEGDGTVSENVRVSTIWKHGA